jgi:acetyl-CoA acetyltransferase family protein
MTPDAVIVDAVRTATGKGKPTGALAGVHPVDLLSQVFTALIDRNSVDPATMDDLIIGCVSQVGEQSATPGRMAWLGAGYPSHVPATTIDRKCGSSQQAVHFAVQGVRAGEYDTIVAGGVESMSRVRMGSARLDADPFGAGVAKRYAPGLVSQGVAAELVAAKYKIGRTDSDEFAAASHRLAAIAADAGSFEREIVDIDTPDGVFKIDETIRRGTDAAKLAELKAVFETPELRERFPDVEWGVSAGNSSQIVDGASALLIMSESRAADLGLRARARVHSMSVCGDDPVLMLTGPIPATHQVLAKSGLSIGDMDHVEINEAFAPVPLAWLQEFDIDPAKVNPRGGAIALGHALGSSGTRLMTTMLHALEDTGGRYGLQVMCEAGGMANATIIERL